MGQQHFPHFSVSVVRHWKPFCKTTRKKCLKKCHPALNFNNGNRTETESKIPPSLTHSQTAINDYCRREEQGSRLNRESLPFRPCRMFSPWSQNSKSHQKPIRSMWAKSFTFKSNFSHSLPWVEIIYPLLMCTVYIRQWRRAPAPSDALVSIFDLWCPS